MIEDESYEPFESDQWDVVGSCSECGCDLYPDDDLEQELCDQCAWWLMEANGTYPEESNHAE